MKKKILIFVFLVVIFSLAFSVIARSRATKQSHIYVTKVIDGDTVELSNGDSVRYIGIDTPEIRKRNKDEWEYDPMPYAIEAKSYNRKLVEGKKVKLEFDIKKYDKYNRLLAYLYVDNKMVNIELVRRGYAILYTYPPNIKYVGKFLEAQKEAKDKQNGLWKNWDKEIISSREAKENIGYIKIIETKVLDTYLTDKILILKCSNNFKIVLFKSNFKYFTKEAIRSPNTYFKGRRVRIHGIIKKYKNDPEVILNDPSQLGFI